MLRIGDRVRKIFSLLGEDIDCILSIKRSNPNPTFSYITGLTRGFFEGSIAICRREDKSVKLITSGLDKVEKDYIEVFIANNQKKIKDEVKNLIRDCSVIGFDAKYTSFYDYKLIKRWTGGRKLRDISKGILLSRLTKDDHELKMIKRACKVSEKVFEELLNILREGISEREVASQIDFLVKEYGGDETAFKSIVAFGKNSAIPHHIPGNKKLKRNEIVLLDFGARYEGYVSDITRSFVYGRADDKIRGMFETVLEAQDIGKRAIRGGTRFETVHRRVFEFIEKTTFKGKFIHSTGHTIGLEVHDGFSLAEGTKEKFFDGVVFTIEPGIYLKSIGGIRIEDDFVFQNGRVKRLTHAPIFLETSS